MSEQRIFLAIPVPSEALEKLAAMRDRSIATLGADVLRAVHNRNFHITLHFLGYLDDSGVDRARAALRDAFGLSGTDELQMQFDAPKVRFSNADIFPAKGPARVLLVHADDKNSGIKRAHRALADALTAHGFETDDRVFNPHVTLAYVRKKVRKPTLREVREWARNAPPLDSDDLQPWSLPEVTLFRSTLTSGGAQYEALESVQL